MEAGMPKIDSCKVIVFESCWATGFHVSANNELLHVLDGSFELTYSDGRRFPGVKGDTFIIPRGIVHKDVFELKRDLKILFIGFSWEDPENLLPGLDNSRLNFVSPETRSELREIFERMREPVAPPFEKIDAEIADLRLYSVLLILKRGLAAHQRASSVQAEPHHGIIPDAKKYIARNFASKLRLADIAARLKVSPFHLSRVFNRENDLTLCDYILEIRIAEAKKLLRDGRWLVSEVASMTGFENPNYFAKVFKRKVGCPPGKFR